MTAAGVAPQIITDCRHVTTGFKHFGLCASKFLNEMQSYFSCEKRTLDHWTTVQFITDVAVSRGLCFRNLLKKSVHGGAWCTDTSLCPLPVKLSKVLETPLLDNPANAAVISVSFASFTTLIFPSCQLSVHILQFSTLWTASPVSSYLLWLTPHGVYWLSPSVAVLTWIGVP